MAVTRHWSVLVYYFLAFALTGVSYSARAEAIFCHFIICARDAAAPQEIYRQLHLRRVGYGATGRTRIDGIASGSLVGQCIGRSG